MGELGWGLSILKSGMLSTSLPRAGPIIPPDLGVLGLEEIGYSISLLVFP